MDYINNVNKLIKNYMVTFMLNSIVFILTLSLGIETKWLIILSVLIAIISIISYNILKKSKNSKNVAFHILTIAISLSISAVYRHFSYGIGLTKSTDRKVSIVSILLLVLVFEILYLIMKLLINNLLLYKMTIVISLIISSTLVFIVYYLGKGDNFNFSAIFWLTIFYSVIFFSSMVSILFLKEDEKFQFVLMASHFFIFLIVFIIAITIISEDGSALELFAPDGYSKKNKGSS